MLVELLYFDGCPHYEQFLPHLRGLLEATAVSAPVQLVPVVSEREAQRLRFLGSPTLRLDGVDVEPAAAGRRDYGMQCRVYAADAGLRGTPPDGLVLAAVAAALNR